MNRLQWGLLGVAVGCGVLWLARPLPPPTTLTESQKVAISQKVHTELMHGQMLYNLPATIPPAVSFAVLDSRNAAESLCVHKLVSDGVPAWALNINQKMAAQNYHAVLRATIPHEVAHLLRCQFDTDWQAHDARWESIVRDMGSTPVAQHDYRVEE